MFDDLDAENASVLPEGSPREPDSHSITFAPSGTPPLIGAPWSYVVRGDNQSSGTPQDIGALVSGLWRAHMAILFMEPSPHHPVLEAPWASAVPKGGDVTSSEVNVKRLPSSLSLLARAVTA